MKKQLTISITKLKPKSKSKSKSLIRTLTTSTSSNFALKNVTKSNFDETLIESLRNHIKAADFIAIDLEMTGVTSSPWRESFEFDRYDVRYLKVKDSAEKFAVVQFGLCPFRWDSKASSFVAHPHNFYIFPRQELPTDWPSYEFLCQTTSIEFLAKYQFDFNACIREGVSYLSRRQEDEALSRLTSGYNGKWKNADELRDVPLGNIADILFSERMKIRLSEWRTMCLSNRSSEIPSLPSAIESKQQFETIFFCMRPALRLNGFTSYQLKLIEMVTRKHFKDLVFVRAYDESSTLQKLIVYIESDNDKINLMEEVKDASLQQARRKIKAAVGFRHIIDLLANEKKLIVGHNCFLDMTHMYHKFFGPLPSTLEEFVLDFRKSFPHIVDTKILLNADTSLQKLMNKTSTSLASSFSLLCPEISSGRSDGFARPCLKVEVQVDDMRSSNWNSGAKHEAGYDAFMTGCVFAQACSHLGVDFSTEEAKNCEKLQKYANLLYLSWNSGDVINLSTGDMNEIPICNSNKRRFLSIVHRNIVFIWGFSPKLKAREIKQCICKVFGLHSVASIYSLDETAVFVQFSNADLAANFLVLKESLETSDDSISVLHPLSKLLEGGKTCAAGYEIYRDICSSSIYKFLFAEQVKALGINWKTKLLEPEGNGQDLEEHNELTEETARLRASSAMGSCEVTKLRKEVQKSTSNESIFDKILYSTGSESNLEIKVTNSYNS